MAGIDNAPVNPPSDNSDCVDNDHHDYEEGDDDCHDDVFDCEGDDDDYHSGNENYAVDDDDVNAVAKRWRELKNGRN